MGHEDSSRSGNEPHADRGPADMPRENTQAKFQSTQWSEVFRAQREDEVGQQALDRLCLTYWPPIYAFIRRRGIARSDAQDLTQAFFADLLRRDWLNKVGPKAGKLFRSFLLACVTNFLNNEHDKQKALRRGGGQQIFSLDFETEEGRFIPEPGVEVSPEKEFDRRWVCALIESVTKQLGREMEAVGKGNEFETLQGFLTGDIEKGSYTEVAASLQMSEGTLRVNVHRLRRRFGELLRENIARTVSDPSDVEDELRYLLGVWGRP